MRSSLVILCATQWIAATSVVFAQTPPSFADRNPRYHLQPNDVIEVQYRYTPEYNQTASVQPDGFVSLQLIGNVKVSGLTIDEATATLHGIAASRLRDPDVTVLLRDYDKPHFVVGGEVANPGRFELRGTLTVLEGIAMAGGFKTASALNSQVILVRRVNADVGETKILNLKQVVDERQFQENLELRPGDMLIVPQNRISKIERFVKWGSVGLFWNPVK